MSSKSEREVLVRQAMEDAKFTTASGHARADCPFCEDRVGKTDTKQCFSIHLASGWFSCWRCHIKGRLDGMEDNEWVPEAAPEKPPVIPPPEDFATMESLKSAISAGPARKYLRSRGLPESVWYAAGVGACLSGHYAGRVVVPVTAPDGEWLGWVGRIWTKKSPSPMVRTYLNCPGMRMGGHVYNHAALLVETEKPVLVVEGCFDAIAHWPDAVAVLGKPGEAQVQELAQARRPVVVVLDGDAWAEGWAMSMQLRLAGQRAGHVRLPPCKDPDEVDPGWLWDEAKRSLDDT